MSDLLPLCGVLPVVRQAGGGCWWAEGVWLVHHLPKSIRHAAAKVICIQLIVWFPLLMSSVGAWHVYHIMILTIIRLIFLRFGLIGIELIEILAVDVARDLRPRHRCCDVSAHLRPVKRRRHYVVCDLLDARERDRRPHTVLARLQQSRYTLRGLQLFQTFQSRYVQADILLVNDYLSLALGYFSTMEEGRRPGTEIMRLRCLYELGLTRKVKIWIRGLHCVLEVAVC